jgi:hypothetical protein
MNRKQRLKKLSDMSSIVQDGKDFVNMIAPGTFTPAPATPTSKIDLTQKTPDDAAKKPDAQLDVAGAVSYNIKSEETFKTHEDKIKKLLGTTANWNTPEFAQAVYSWQKSNGLTGKWMDGKFGPLTMNELAKTDPELKEKYNSQSMAAFLPGGKVKLRLTGYWPFTARPDERKMEGGIFDRKMPKGFADKPDSKQYQAHVLHTAEQHLADPIKHPFVSLSGDDAIWPYGQEIDIPWTDNKTLRGRVVDTGSHFRGAGKMYRTPGYEPIDVCVNSSQTKVPLHVTAQIVGGSGLKQPNLVAFNKATKRIKNAKQQARMLLLLKKGEHERARAIVQSFLTTMQKEINPAAKVISFKPLASHQIRVKYISPVWDEPQTILLLRMSAGHWADNFEVWYAADPTPGQYNREILRFTINPVTGELK